MSSGPSPRPLDAAADGEILFVGHPRRSRAREILDAIRLAVGRPAMVIPVPQAITRLAAVVGAISSARVVGRPLPLNRWRYVELSAEGFVCRVDRLRDRLGDRRRARTCAKDLPTPPRGIGARPAGSDRNRPRTPTARPGRRCRAHA